MIGPNYSISYTGNFVAQIIAIPQMTHKGGRWTTA